MFSCNINKILFSRYFEALTLREKCLNADFFSGPYFPVFELEYGPEKTPYLNTFHAV